MSGLAVTEAELHAHVGRPVARARRAEVEEYLATHLEDAQRVRAWREQNADLRAWFDPVLAETLPARLRRAASGTAQTAVRYARRSSGWISLRRVSPDGFCTITRSRSRLTRWLSPIARSLRISFIPPKCVIRSRLAPNRKLIWSHGYPNASAAGLKIPQLTSLGYHLVGGRLLPGNRGPVAQFMFQDGSGQRLTLYVRRRRRGKETAFRYAQERGISVFYWVDGTFGYAISGEIDKDRTAPRGKCRLPAAKSLDASVGSQAARTAFSAFMTAASRSAFCRSASRVEIAHGCGTCIAYACIESTCRAKFEPQWIARIQKNLACDIDGSITESI